MFWSCRCYCGILRPRLGARICKWQRRRAAWSDASTLGQFWQISYGSAEPLCCRQQCRYILLYFTQYPSIHPDLGRSTAIRILGSSNCCVSGVFFFAHVFFYLSVVNKQRCPPLDCWRPPIFCYHHQLSWINRILDLYVHCHYSCRTSLLPQKRSFIIRHNSMECSQTPPIWNRCWSCERIVFWSCYSLYEPGMVYGCHSSYDGRYRVWGLFCGRRFSVFFVPLDRNSMQRIFVNIYIYIYIYIHTSHLAFVTAHDVNSKIEDAMASHPQFSSRRHL